MVVTSIRGPKSVADEDLHPDSPFYSLLLENKHLPRERRQPEPSRAWMVSAQISSEWRTFDPGSAEGFKQWLQELRSLYSSPKGALVVETINDKMITALRTLYPLVDLEFLHQHVSACDGPQGNYTRNCRSVTGLSPSKGPQTTTCGGHFDGLCIWTFSQLPDETERVTGVSFHHTNIRDYPFALETMYRTERFVSQGSKWQRLSTRISCCELGSGFCRWLLTPCFCMSLMPKP